MNFRDYWHEHGWRTVILVAAFLVIAFILIKVATAAWLT